MVGEGQLRGSGLAGCQCSVLGEGRVTTNGGSVLWLGGGVTIRRSGRALLGTIAGCQSLFHIFVLFSGPSHPDNQENNNEFCLELLADVALFSTLITQKLFFAIWGLCWYSFFLPRS